MKGIRKILSGTIAAAILTATFPAVQVSAANKLIVSDNFDSYTPVSIDLTTEWGIGIRPSVEGFNTSIASGNVPLVVVEDLFGDLEEVWSAKKTTGNYGVYNDAATGIIDNYTTEEADGNILALEGRVGDSEPQNSPAVGYMSPLSFDADTEYVYSVDFYNTCIKAQDEWRATGVSASLRFNVTGNKFYELSANSYGVSLYKVEGSSFTKLDSVSVNVPANAWHTMSASVLGGRISWKLINTDGTLLANGMYEDVEAPYTVVGSKQELSSRGQFYAYSLFDNFKIEKVDVIEDDGSFSAFSETGILHASDSEDVQMGGGHWYIKQSKNGQTAGFPGANPDFGIVADPSETTVADHGNVLMIESSAATNSPTMFPMVYNSMMNSLKGQNNLYTFDIKRCSGPGNDAGGGIRFNYSGEGAANEYYELFFANDATTLAKKTADGGYVKLDAAITTFGSIGGTVWTTTNRIVPNVWYVVKLSVVDGVICWEVYLENGTLVQIGEYNDSESYLENNSMQTVFFGASQNESMVYFDNITKTAVPTDSGTFTYDATGVKKASGYADVSLIGNWYIKQSKSGQGAGFDSSTVFEIAEDPDGGSRGNVLKIESRAAIGDKHLYPMVYNKAWKVNDNGAYVYSFDFRRSSGEAGGGIRFNYSGSGTNYGSTVYEEGANYYELQFGRSGNVMLSKCVNGVYTTLADGTDFDLNFTPNTTSTYWTGLKQLIPGVWYNIEVIVDGGNISWKAIDAAQADTWMTGSYTDSDPLPIAGTHATFFAGGQGAQYAYFDNASMKEVKKDKGTLDKFEITEALNAYSKGDRHLAGDWNIRGNYNDEYQGYDGKATFAVAAAPKTDGKAFKIDARAGYGVENEWAIPTIYNKTWSVDSSEENTYMFDFYGGDSRNGAVVRFNYSKAANSNKSFYELNFKGGGYVTTLSKLVNGATGSLVDVPAVIEGEQKCTAGIWYSVKLITNGGNISWTVTNRDDQTVLHTGSYVDEEPITGTDLMTMFGARGQGETYVYYDNLYLNPTAEDLEPDEPEQPPVVDPDPPVVDPEPPVKDDETYLTEEGDYRIFTDKFGGYDAENAVIDKDNQVNAIRNDLTVAENTAAAWKLSEVNTTSGKPSAFVDAYAKRLQLTGITRDYTKPYSSVVNLDLTDGSAKSLDSLEATVIPVDGGRTGIRVAVSADEKTYYEFGRGNWHDFTADFNPENYTTTPTGYPKRAPYVLKSVNGVREVIAYPSDLSYSNEAWVTTWKIAIVDGNMEITAEQKRNDMSVAKTWTHSVAADAEILDGFKYPIAIWGATTNTQADDVTVKYIPQKEVYTDNGNGTAEINILASQYDKNAESLTAVTSFYTADDEFIVADDRAVTTEANYTLDIPQDADYAKILLWAGKPYEGKLVGEIVSNDAGPAIAKEDKIIIAAVGDSLTGNDGAQSNHTWSSKLNYLLGEDYIVKNYGKPSYQLMNGSSYSYTTTEEYQNSLKSNADIVIIMLGTNDSGGWTDAVDKEARSQKFYDDYVSLINSYREMESKPEIIIAVPPIRGTAAEPQTNAETYIKPIIKQLSADLDVPYVDMYSLVTDYDLLYDGTHFHDEGYFQFAQRFYEAVAKLVKVETNTTEVVINSTASFNSDAIIGVYNGNKLKAVKKIAVEVMSNEEYPINISDMYASEGDIIKVMFMDDSIKPYTYASHKAVKNVYLKDGKLVISGNTEAGAEAFAVVYDMSGNVVFADSAKALSDGYYEFNAELAAGTYNVVYGANGTAAQNNATIQ